MGCQPAGYTSRDIETGLLLLVSLMLSSHSQIQSSLRLWMLTLGSRFGESLLKPELAP